MALTGMQIYKSLPKTNCKECGYPTCMAFAMQVAGKQKALTDCPRLSESAKSDLADASAPPMKLVKIGPADAPFVIGQETVLFRHEEKFQHGAGIAVKVAAQCSDEQAAAKCAAINTTVFERVGQRLKIALCAVELDGCADPAARAKLAAAKSGVPLILMGKNAQSVRSAAEAVQEGRPLLYATSAENQDRFIEIAAALKLPLALSAGSLEQMAESTAKARAGGVAELVLAFNANHPGETLRTLTIARRAALKKGFKDLGYPAMVDIGSDAPEIETLLACTFAAKYAGIVMINGMEPWEVLPIMTTVQNIYTDPQVPNTVQAKLYEIGNPNENSPVLFTTNFSLTYFSVESEVERSRIPAYIVAVETEGLGVLNAYAGDKISVEKVVKTLTDLKVAEKVKHRKLIIPGLLPIFRAEIEDTSEWKEVIIGPETASKIPAFLNQVWK